MSKYFSLSAIALSSSRLFILSLSIILFVLPLIGFSQIGVHSSAGSLDVTFGSGGKVLTSFSGISANAAACTLQSDGKLVVVGNTYNDGKTSMAVARYNIDGSLDATFGTGGKVTTNFFGGFDAANAVSIQPDGKIIVGGAASQINQDADFGLARYNPDGSLDVTFGTGGKVATDFLGKQDLVYAIALQPDGKIIAAGQTYTPTFSIGLSLARYNADGSLDVSFGDNGKVLGSTQVGIEYAVALARQGDGKIVVGGPSQFSLQTGIDFAVARFNSNGSPDISFGIGGQVRTSFTNSQDAISAIAIQPDGKIVAGGFSQTGNPKTDFVLARYKSDGSLDPTFGVGGKVLTVSENDEFLAALALQPDGRIIAGGFSRKAPSTIDFCIARYTIDGRPDASFGSNGKVLTDFAASDDYLSRLTLQPDGKIIAVGSESDNTGQEFAIARYEGGSNFDLCIQDDSSSNILQINTLTGDYQFTNCAGLGVGGTGTITHKGGSITLQQGTGDHRVIAKIDTATKKATASIQILSTGRTFSITDRDITNNTCTCR